MKTTIKTLAVIMTVTLIFAMTACGKKPEETTATTTAAPETTVTETEETTIATTVTEETTETTLYEIPTEETTTAAAGSIDELFNAVTNDYFEMQASLDTNEDIIGSRGALGVAAQFNIFEFRTTEGLKVGDKISIASTNPAENGKIYEYTIAAINGNYVLIAVEWDANYNTNVVAPYTNPDVQAVYDAFVAYKG